MLRIENREALACRDITKDLIGCDEMIDGLLPFKPNRNRYLDSIESAKPEIEGILFKQALGQSEFRFTHRKNFELSGDNVFAELAQEQSGILASNELSPDLNREHRR